MWWLEIARRLFIGTWVWCNGAHFSYLNVDSHFRLHSCRLYEYFEKSFEVLQAYALEYSNPMKPWSSSRCKYFIAILWFDWVYKNHKKNEIKRLKITCKPFELEHHFYTRSIERVDFRHDFCTPIRCFGRVAMFRRLCILQCTVLPGDLQRKISLMREF